MQGMPQVRNADELKALVGEASQALARLDAERLEELALSCRALHRGLQPGDTQAMTPEAAREARRQMAVFGRVLEVTHGNLEVLRQIRSFEAGLLEYRAPAGPQPAAMEPGHGVD